ncbi:hypothetical protein Hanom_Chr04g00287071 [Helianthus anomalus]
MPLNMPLFVFARFIFFFERQIWITDGPLGYNRATSRTTRSYPSPLDNNAYTPIQEETQ